jgi:DNA-binding transcriptional ArsR family regulator
MPREDQVTLDRASFKALSSEARIRILKALDDKRMTLSDLSRKLDLAKPTLLEHLSKLETAILIRKEDEGRKWIYYSLSRKGKRILHPERTRIRLLFSFSAALIIVGMLVLVYTWILPAYIQSWYTQSTSSHVMFPFAATILTVFGVIVLIFAFRELAESKKPGSPSPSD